MFCDIKIAIVQNLRESLFQLWLFNCGCQRDRGGWRAIYQITSPCQAGIVAACHDWRKSVRLLLFEFCIKTNIQRDETMQALRETTSERPSMRECCRLFHARKIQLPNKLWFIADVWRSRRQPSIVLHVISDYVNAWCWTRLTLLASKRNALLFTTRTVMFDLKKLSRLNRQWSIVSILPGKHRLWLFHVLSKKALDTDDNMR